MWQLNVIYIYLKTLRNESLIHTKLDREVLKAVFPVWMQQFRTLIGQFPVSFFRIDELIQGQRTCIGRISAGKVRGRFYGTASSFVWDGIYFCLLALDWIKDDKTWRKRSLSGHERICTCLNSEENECTCRQTFKEQMIALFSNYSGLCENVSFFYIYIYV